MSDEDSVISLVLADIVTCAVCGKTPRYSYLTTGFPKLLKNRTSSIQWIIQKI